MQAAQGNLTILNAHTSTPRVFWNGNEILGVVRIRVLSDEDDHRVKITVSGGQVDLYADMRNAGVLVKEVSL
jgi:hypothetical protein